MRFSEPAQAYFGFQPRADATELRAAACLHSRRLHAVIAIQRMARARVGRTKALAAQRKARLHKGIVAAQAAARGHATRVWYRAWREQVGLNC
jgi:hypothetical protein